MATIRNAESARARYEAGVPAATPYEARMFAMLAERDADAAERVAVAAEEVLLGRLSPGEVPPEARRVAAGVLAEREAEAG